MAQCHVSLLILGIGLALGHPGLRDPCRSASLFPGYSICFIPLLQALHMRLRQRGALSSSACPLGRKKGRGWIFYRRFYVAAVDNGRGVHRGRRTVLLYTAPAEALNTPAPSLVGAR